jgi:short-subunit dehydrogenase
VQLCKIFLVVIFQLVTTVRAMATPTACTGIFPAIENEEFRLPAESVLPGIWPSRAEIPAIYKQFHAQLNHAGLGTALVLGGSDGLGGGYASSLAKIGFNVVIVARREHQLNLKREELLPLGRRVLTISADLSERSSIQRVIETIKDQGMWDDLTMVVAAAGAEFSDAQIKNFPADGARMRDIKAVVQPAIVTSVAENWSQTEFSGKVVLLSSVSGLAEHGVPNRKAYSETNRRFLQFGQDLQMKYHKDWIDVYNVAPGSVDTPGLRKILNTQERWNSYWQFSRYTTVNEVVRESILASLKEAFLDPILPAGAREDLKRLETWGLFTPWFGGVQDYLARRWLGE